MGAASVSFSLADLLRVLRLPDLPERCPRLTPSLPGAAPAPGARERHLDALTVRELWIVRHGESAGNVARERPRPRASCHRHRARDVDVPLSARSASEQARALGRWFAGLPATSGRTSCSSRPTSARGDTAELIREAGGLAPEPRRLVVDERLREKEFGVLDRLTRYGIAQNDIPSRPSSARLLGKFYYRPPGGESWCDVILRLRSALDTISLHYGGERVLVVATR